MVKSLFNITEIKMQNINDINFSEVFKKRVKSQKQGFVRKKGASF